jgi:hypothetical protein
VGSDSSKHSIFVRFIVFLCTDTKSTAAKQQTQNKQKGSHSLEFRVSHVTFLLQDLHVQATIRREKLIAIPQRALVVSTRAQAANTPRRSGWQKAVPFCHCSRGAVCRRSNDRKKANINARPSTPHADISCNLLLLSYLSLATRKADLHPPRGNGNSRVRPREAPHKNKGICIIIINHAAKHPKIDAHIIPQKDGFVNTTRTRMCACETSFLYPQNRPYQDRRCARLGKNLHRRIQQEHWVIFIYFFVISSGENIENSAYNPRFPEASPIEILQSKI